MRTSQSIDFMGLTVTPADVPAGKDHFVVKDLFTTFDGSWELGGNIFALPGWARAAYLKPTGHPEHFDDAGGATHLFVRVEDGDGRPLNLDILFATTAGLTVRANTGGKRSGWCNLFMNRDSAFDPHAGERGPWSIRVDGVPSELVSGLGLPFRWHVSTFVVFQRKRADDEVIVVGPTEPTEPGTLDDRLSKLEAEFAELKRLVIGMIAEYSIPGDKRRR